MHPHHPYLSEAVLVHLAVFALLAAMVALALVMLVRVAGPELHALLVGLGG